MMGRGFVSMMRGGGFSVRVGRRWDVDDVSAGSAFERALGMVHFACEMIG